MKEKYTAEEKQWQNIRRGRLVNRFLGICHMIVEAKFTSQRLIYFRLWILKLIDLLTFTLFRLYEKENTSKFKLINVTIGYILLQKKQQKIQVFPTFFMNGNDMFMKFQSGAENCKSLDHYLRKNDKSRFEWHNYVIKLCIIWIDKIVLFKKASLSLSRTIEA